MENEPIRLEVDRPTPEELKKLYNLENIKPSLFNTEPDMTKFGVAEQNKDSDK